MKQLLGYIEEQLVDSGMRVKVKNFHAGNSSPWDRCKLVPNHCHAKAPAFVTVTTILDDKGKTVGNGVSSCNPCDTIDKKKGRHLSVYRAAKNGGLL